MTEQRREVPVVGEYRWEILQADDLYWLVEDKLGNDSLTVLHEMDPPGVSVHDYICSWFTPGRVFLDVGAHEGHYALRAARAGCKVIAVEANPETAAVLRYNCLLNETDVTIWAFAAWDQPGTLEISLPPKAKLRCGSASVAAPGASEDGPYTGTGITVAAMHLDAMDLDRLDVVKLDVEGSDLQVIDGMMETLVRCRPVIIHESHLQYHTYTEAQMQERYDELTDRAGYKWADIRDLGTETPYMYAVGIPDGDHGRGDSR